MRTTINNHIEQKVTSTHLELGLLFSTMLMLKYDKKGLSNVFRIIAEHLPKEDDFKESLAGYHNSIRNKLNGTHVFCCGFESVLVDELVKNFKSVLIIPNAVEIDFERIALNYMEYPEVQVTDPFHAGNLVCPDTSILVPLYPLQDGTLLSYNYASKLLTIEARKNSYQIVGLHICQPLPIQFSYDRTGLCKVMTPVEPLYFTDFITLND
ncbi:MAG: hypothetical protein K8S00_10225 [Bacteroidales bacterium]|nr:hypothetical protein [Bacteroidales bacterium]